MNHEQRLLILDDEPAVAKTMQIIAQKLGFSVRCCTSPEAFFEEVDGWQPTHIAIDLVMPAMDGIEVLRHLGLIGCRAKIILTSGIGNRVLESAGRSAHNHGLSITGTLPKPFRPALLRELLLSTEISTRDSTSNKCVTDFIIDAESIAHALHHKQFELYYQPKLDLTLRRITAFEALIRWNHPVHGQINPDNFISFSEGSGQIDAITEMVFDMGLEWLAQLSHSYPISLQINIAASSLEDINMADRLDELCRLHNVEQRQITLEITESCVMSDFNLSRDVFNRLRIKGFELAIDDFGTGYSSMSQLTKLPFSELKIDKSFVVPSTNSGEAGDVVRLTVELARNLGMLSVAEGVENLETLQFLRRVGCNLAQGYFISPPMRGEHVASWLSRH
jgi:EAL domain-containing protein (putative c-di-GMP-specific phosphodiesterase class I)